MVWFGSKIFSTNKESMILSKCLIKSLLFVITFVPTYSEPGGKFKQIQICFINLPNSSRKIDALISRFTAIAPISERVI